jgi:hypothetical protein
MRKRPVSRFQIALDVAVPSLMLRIPLRAMLSRWTLQRSLRVVTTLVKAVATAGVVVEDAVATDVADAVASARMVNPKFPTTMC